MKASGFMRMASRVLFTVVLFGYGISAFSQETEPNNTVDQANYFTLNGTLTAAIGVAGDQDWFKVTIPEEGVLKFISHGITNNDYYLNLYDVDGVTNLMWIEVYPLGENDSVYQLNFQAGTYFLQVTPYGSYTGTYSVTNKFIPALLPNDDEPNNTSQQAREFDLNSTTTGRLNYVYDGNYDNSDWFMLTTSEEGILKIKSTSPDMNDYYIELFDVDGETSLMWMEVYPINETDSVFRTNLQAGTYYLNIRPYSAGNRGSYYVTNIFTPALLPSDNEPNDTYSLAQVFEMNSTLTGRLNYVYLGNYDASDWFSITIPEEGTLKIKSHSEDIYDYYIELYDVDGERSLMWSEVYPNNEIDSVFRTNLQAGKYYLWVHPYSALRHGSYYLTNTFTPALLPNDQEPNDAYTQAQVFDLNSATTGRLNYVYNNDYDEADWFSLTIPEEGTLKIKSHSPDCNDYYIELFDVDGERSLMWSEVYPVGETDSVYRMNLQAGKYFLKLKPYWGENHGSYHVINTFTPALLPNDQEPNDTYQQARLLTMNSETTGRINYVYDDVYDTRDWYKVVMPGNGGLKITSVSQDILRYDVRLVDVNGQTVLASAAVYNYTPSTVLGWSLTGGATYFIDVASYYSYVGSYHLAVEYQPAPVPSFTTYQNLMNVLFTNTSQYGTTYSWDFGDGATSTQVNPSHTYALPGGYYITLTATNPNGSNEYEGYVEFRGIQKVEGKHGGNNGKATITVFAGGLDDQCIPVLRKGSQEIQGTQVAFPKKGQIQGLFDLSGAETGVWDVVVKQGTSEMMLAGAYTIEQGKAPEVYVAVNGRNRALINRWSTWTVEIGNRGNTDAYYQILWIAVPDSVQFKNVVFDLSLYEDPEAEEYLAQCPPYWELDTLGTAPFKGRLYGIPFDRIPADSKYSIQLRIKAVQNFQLVAFAATPWFTEDDYTRTMSYNECVAWAMAKFIADKLVEQLTPLVPGADCVYAGIKSLHSVTSKYMDGKLSVTSMTWDIAQVMWKCLKDLGSQIPWVKAMQISKVMIDITVDIINCYNADKECEQYKMKTPNQINVSAVTSLDPNEIAGPGGFTDNHYIRDNETSYTVFFENVSSATSNAVEVFIYDTLSNKKYDLESFRFMKVWIAGSMYDVLMDGDGFALDVDLRPRLNTIARVSGTIDRTNGAAYWHFMSLDPLKMDITEDPEAGFLPPNVDKPEGEGAVSYSVNLKSSVIHNDQVAARAKIVFDFNAPIETNTFVNVIDRQPPSSSVYDIQPVNEQGLYEIFWQGNDNGAGVNHYNIYRAEGWGDYVLWRNNMPALSDTMTAIAGTSYKFFCQAVDNLGNEEPYKGFPEKVLGIKDGGTSGVSFKIIPNPAYSNAIIRFQILRPVELQIEILSNNGQVVYRSEKMKHDPGKQDHRVNISGFAPGVYMVVIKTEEGVSAEKLVIGKE